MFLRVVLDRHDLQLNLDLTRSVFLGRVAHQAIARATTPMSKLSSQRMVSLVSFLFLVAVGHKENVEDVFIHTILQGAPPLCPSLQQNQAHRS